MQPRGLPDGDTTWREGMNRTGRSESAPVARRSRADGIAYAIRIELEEAADGFGVTWRGGLEPLPGKRRVDRAQTGCQKGVGFSRPKSKRDCITARLGEI